MPGRTRSWRQPTTEHRHEADGTEEEAHDEDLRGDEELHDEEGRQAEAVADGRVLLADQDLVQRVKRNGGITSTVTDTWPKMSDVTMAAE